MGLKQLNSVYTHSDEAFDSMNKLRRDLLTWQEMQIAQDKLAKILRRNTLVYVHGREIMRISAARLDCLCLELKYHVKFLVPSPFLMAQQVYDTLEVHKSVIQGIISDMTLLELKFPHEEDLKDRRSDHEAEAREIDGYLDNILMTIRAFAVRPP